MNFVPNFLALDLKGDEVMALILGFTMFMIPIVFILTKHQQRMTELLKGKNQGNDQQIQALATQVERLTQALHSQTLAVDELSQRLNTLPQTPPKAPEDTPRTYLAQ